MECILENADRFFLAGEALAELRDGYSQWTKLYLEFQNPKLQTLLRQAQLNTIMKRMDKLLRQIHNFLQGHPLIELTDDDRLSLNIPVKKPYRLLTAPPSEVPVNYVIANHNGVFTIGTKCYDENPENQSKRRPRRTRLMLFMAFTDSPDIIPSEADFHAFKFTGRMRYKLDLRDRPSKTDWLKTRFSNTRGMGIPSEIISFTTE